MDSRTAKRSIIARGTVTGVFAFVALAPLSQSFAAEAECKQLFAAMTQLYNTPSHQYLTQTTADTGDQATMSEIINTGKAMYIRVDGKWHNSKVTSEQLQHEEEENRKNAKVTTCRIVGEDSVEGVAVTTFTAHTETESGSSDEHMWISKANGLLVRETIDMDMGARGGKSHAEIRVVYSGVTAPTTIVP